MEEQFKTSKACVEYVSVKPLGSVLEGSIMFYVFSLNAGKGIVFSRYTTNSNVCSSNLKISVRGFIHKINGNSNSDKKN